MGLKRIGFIILLCIVGMLFYTKSFAEFNSVVAQPSNIFINSSTLVIFVADIPSNPKLMKSSIRLLKETNGVISVIGTMYDDGTHGDVTANDNKYTTQLIINEPDTKILNYRVSAAYSGVVQRDQSSVFSVNVVPSLNLTIIPGQSELYINQGQSASTAFTLSIQNDSGQMAHLTASEAISPSTGLGLVSDYPGGWSTNSADQTYLIQNTFTGQTVGDYTVTVSGYLTTSEMFQDSSASLLVHVLPVSGEAGKLSLSSTPSGIEASKSTNVVFAAVFSGGSESPSSVTLDEVDSMGNLITPNLAGLADNGNGADVTANDGIYTGNVLINAGIAGADRYFRVTGQFAGGTASILSDVYKLKVVPYKVGFLTGNPSSIVEGEVASNGEVGIQLIQEKFYCDQVLVIFKPDTAFAAIEAAASSVNGSVVGTEPALNSYQFSIPCNGVSGVQEAIGALLQNPDVLYAEPNVIIDQSEFTPNDTGWVKQYAPVKVRADEAWVIGRGGISIAIVDTGVDYTHPDLSGKVINGYDFANNDTDAMDDNGHGTHCAGIAAAKGNNGLGIAGISWNSNILAVKVLNAAGYGSWTSVASGILYASTKAKIISMSLGGSSSSRTVSSAVATAIANGSLIIAAAGNTGNSVPQYPCSETGVLCVGSTTSTDARSSFSTYGPQVDIAAPGSSIYSTYPVNKGSYATLSGTSMATPLVAGAAALVWSNFPSWSAAKIQARLIATAMPLPGLQIGPRVDAFDALFNGNFEDGLNGWNVSGTGSAVTALGPISPPKDKIMGMASTGPDSSVSSSELWQQFTVQPGVVNIPIKFSYAFVTEEYPEWVGSQYNDYLSVIVVKPDGSQQTLAYESVNGSMFSLISGIDFPGGDSTTGWTGWKNLSINVPITAGPGTYKIHVSDQGDGIYDSNVVVDNIRFK